MIASAEMTQPALIEPSAFERDPCEKQYLTRKTAHPLRGSFEASVGPLLARPEASH